MLPDNFEDRWYQREAAEALMRDISFFSPVIAVPTGGGKTAILGRFSYKYIEKNPLDRVLVLAHTQEILKQDHATLMKFFPGINIGLYSSGLKSKTVEKITVAGIQSCYNKPELFKDFDLIVVDEAHCVGTDKKSMYRKFLTGHKARVCGMSGTVFRKGLGYIYEGEESIFDKLSYDLTSVDKFNRLVEEGYLSRLISKRAETELDTKGVKVTGGDYNIKQLSDKFDRGSITDKAVKEAIQIGKHNYKSWLVFAIDVNHAEHINEKFLELGYKSRALHTKTNKDRDEIIQQFKDGEIQVLVSVGMITTGFDAPNIDLIIMLRPTKSAVLHVQTIGRGLRTCEGKDHCLVLDFSGNIKRLGPINNVLVPKKKGEKGGGEAPVKECPKCGCLHPTLLKVCDVCGHEFEFKQKITTVSGNESVVLEKKESWVIVHKVLYYIHQKIGKPDSMKVVYLHAAGSIQDFVCLEHGGYAQIQAENWVNFRWDSNLPTPGTVNELFTNRAKLRTPAKILVDMTQKYPLINDVMFV